jgi:hypothetical protein
LLPGIDFPRRREYLSLIHSPAVIGGIDGKRRIITAVNEKHIEMIRYPGNLCNRWIAVEMDCGCNYRENNYHLRIEWFLATGMEGSP